MLNAWLRRLDARRRQRQPIDRSLKKVTQAIEEAVALRAARAAAAGRALTYPEELPISQRRAEIAEAIAGNQVVVVCGETGSGKTTQLPKICLEMGRGVDGLIGHTQPRRVAARSVAERIAAEVGSELGGMIGWQVRFTQAKSSRTCVKVMTDGILLAESQHDRALLAYDTLIIDEAHERSLNIDFLLGYCRRLLAQRDDLKVIVTSATIDAERFSRHFGDCPVIEVSGRVHPVEVRYQSHDSLQAGSESEGLPQAVEESVRSLLAEGVTGDMLVFLSGEREIHEALDHLQGAFQDRLECLPLYARLAPKKQRRVFEPGERQRVILATNVAETSLTVPRIAAVIDSGMARVSRYSARARVQRLPIEQISQASARQRAGRCGRVGPGTCIRLYSEETYEASEPFTQPEILRSNLANVILRMLALGLGDIDAFPFLERPPGRMVEEGWATLLELGAVDRSRAITDIGRAIARLPIDPRIGRMLVASIDERALSEVLVIASLLSIQDPRERPRGGEESAALAQAAWRDEKSDYVGLLRLWCEYRRRRKEDGSSATRRWCSSHYLSWVRMLEWSDVYAQLRELVEEVLGVRAREPRATQLGEGGWGAIHRSILSGLVSNIGRRTEEREYAMASGASFVVHPSSGLVRRDAPWVVAAELVETTRRYGRLVAKIRGDWVERVAPHLVRREYEEPHYLVDSGQVAAYERVYYGNLVVVPRRRVPFGPIDPATARDIFIQEALVEEQLRTRAPFLKQNAQLRKRIELLEEKERRRDLLASVEARFAFYDQRIPAEIHNAPSFERWRSRMERSKPDLLRMHEADLLRASEHSVDPSQFPDAIAIAGAHLPLQYRHEPGEHADGVSLEVSLAGLMQLDGQRLEWLVPGVLSEKILALIRSLPKRLRTRFNPAKETAEGAVDSLPFGEGDLYATLASYLSQVGIDEVSAADFDRERLPEHLRMLVIVRDEAGKEIARGRSLGPLVTALRERAEVAFRSRVDALESSLECSGLSGFPTETIPETVQLAGVCGSVCAWPALVLEGDGLGVAMFNNQDDARHAHHLGVLRALLLHAGEAFSGLLDWLLDGRGLELLYAPLGSGELLREQIERVLAEAVFLSGDRDSWSIRDSEVFDAVLEAGLPQLGEEADAVVGAFEGILTKRNALLSHLGTDHQGASSEVFRDMVSDVERLAPADLSGVGWRAVREAPRRLEAVVRRLARLSEKGPARDQRDRELLMPWVERFNAAQLKWGQTSAFREYAFAMEEYRVHLSAPALSLPGSGSERALMAAWSKVSALDPAGFEPMVR